MKIETKKRPQGFQPITLTITIESEADLAAVRVLDEQNYTLAEYAAKYPGRTAGSSSLSDINAFFKAIGRSLGEAGIKTVCREF